MPYLFQNLAKCFDKPTKLEILFSLGLLLLLCLSIFIKRKIQVGKTWDVNSKMGSTSKITIKNRPLVCFHCGDNIFGKREGLVTTSWITFWGWTIYNKSARCFICKNCGFLHWFVFSDKYQEIRHDDNPES
jgi:hypothetical protein